MLLAAVPLLALGVIAYLLIADFWITRKPRRKPR